MDKFKLFVLVSVSILLFSCTNQRLEDVSYQGCSLINSYQDYLNDIDNEEKWYIFTMVKTSFELTIKDEGFTIAEIKKQIIKLGCNDNIDLLTLALTEKTKKPI